MASFEELGLRDALLRSLEDGDVEHPTALQEALIPVLRREGNVVARASSGAGKTLAYALGVLDRLEPRAGSSEDDEAEDGEEAGEGAESTVEAAPTGVRALVLVPSQEEAERVALALVPYTQGSGLLVGVPGGGWGTPLTEADVVVAPPAEAMRAVRGSGLKLEALEVVVVDGASDIEAAGGWEALETIFDHAPRDAQRVVVSAVLTEAVDDLVSRRVKRALRYPPQPAVPDAEAVREITGVVGYVIVSEREKVDTLARLLGSRGEGDTPPVVLCRSDERASNLAEELSLRGFAVGEMDDADADVAIATSGTTLAELREESGEEPSLVISYDVPADERTLTGRHGGQQPGYVFVLPRELRHLRDIAERAGLEARAAGISGDESAPHTAVRVFRDELRRALREEDLGAQMLVLEPLFDDFTAAEVAAAAAALLRRRASAPATEPSASGAAPRPQQRSAAPAGRPAREESEAGGAPRPPAISRLFVSVGERDGVRAGDLVGAIAGETNLPGSAIGKVEIRDTFSIVEVPADAADRVIRALNGTTMKGRSLRVDYDRQQRRTGGPGAGGMRRPGTGGAGPRPGGFRAPGGDRGPRFDRGDRPDRGGDRPGGDRPRAPRPPRDDR